MAEPIPFSQALRERTRGVHQESEGAVFMQDLMAGQGSRDDYIGRVLVSELVTNSCVHGEGPVVVRVFRDERDGGAVIEVWDGGDGRPVVRAEDVQATSGRGVFMVSQLALSWGTRPLVEGGKVTWAKCGL